MIPTFRSLPFALALPLLAAPAVADVGAALAHALQILDGADPTKFPRFADYMEKNEHFAAWIRAAEARDAELEAKQRAWLEKSAGKAGR